MAVSGVANVQTMSVSSYSEQMGYQATPQYIMNDGLREAMGKLFRPQKGIMSDDLNSRGMRQYLEDTDYTDLKVQFESPINQKKAPNEVSDNTRSMRETLGKVMYEIELSTMNQIIFGVTTRFGSSINQMIRGQ